MNELRVTLAACAALVFVLAGVVVWRIEAASARIEDAVTYGIARQARYARDESANMLAATRAACRAVRESANTAAQARCDAKLAGGGQCFVTPLPDRLRALPADPCADAPTLFQRDAESP